jgi:RNA polymerase sigma factor (sigma-70 family)
MSKHLDRQQLDRFRQRAMPAEELLVAGDHLVDCVECRGRLGDFIDWRAPLFGDLAHLSDTQDKSPVHLSFEQLTGYTDGRLNEVDRELVERHITDCSVCGAELHDLQRLASELPRESPMRTRGRLSRLITAISSWIVSEPSQHSDVVPQDLPARMESIHQTGELGLSLTNVGDPDPAADPRRLLSDEPTIELVLRAREGDREAVDALLQRSIPELTRWAHGRLPAAARGSLDTGDLVQETVLHVLRRLDHFEPRHVGAMQGYLRQAVIQRIRDEVRRVTRRPIAAQLLGDLVPDYASPLEAAVQGEGYQRYRDALSRLQPKDRELILARIEAQWSVEEIAQRFGMHTSDAARTAVSRALKNLSEEIAR